MVQRPTFLQVMMQRAEVGGFDYLLVKLMKYKEPFAHAHCVSEESNIHKGRSGAEIDMVGKKV